MTMKNEMLINVSQPEECRIAVVEDGVLEELYIERSSQDNYVGNVYKGVVVNLEPTIQAAFVDFGVGRNGFLHISDVEPQYYRQAGIDPAKYMETGGGFYRGEEIADATDGEGDDNDTPDGEVSGENGNSDSSLRHLAMESDHGDDALCGPVQDHVSNHPSKIFCDAEMKY